MTPFPLTSDHVYHHVQAEGSKTGPSGHNRHTNHRPRGVLSLLQRKDMCHLIFCHQEKCNTKRKKKKNAYSLRLHPHQCDSERQTATSIHPHMSFELSWTLWSFVVDDMPLEQSAHRLKHGMV